MTEQLSRHPHRRVQPHPLVDGVLSIAGKLITAPIRGLHYVERSLTGTYTTSQDFSVLEKQLQDIQQRICKANGQAHIDKSQEDVSDVRDAIEDLSAAPVDKMMIREGLTKDLDS